MPTLLDKLIRHQIFLEGLKAGQLIGFNPVLAQLEKTIRSELTALSFESLGDLTKLQLKRLVTTLRVSILKLYNTYTAKLLKFLEEFMSVEIGMLRAIYDRPDEDVEDDDKLVALWWPRFRLGILPANGIELTTFVTSLGPAAALVIGQRLKQAAANRETVKDAIEALTGPEGLRKRLQGQTRAVLATTLQSLSAQSQAALAPILGFLEYEWVSVLDNRTSDICLRRSGQRFLFGKGPLPPAHPNCRSSVVPVVDGEAIPNPTFNVWAKSQSSGLRKSMFGSSKVSERFEGSPAISLDEYETAITLILSE